MRVGGCGNQGGVKATLPEGILTQKMFNVRSLGVQFSAFLPSTFAVVTANRKGREE